MHTTRLRISYKLHVITTKFDLRVTCARKQDSPGSPPCILVLQVLVLLRAYFILHGEELHSEIFCKKAYQMQLLQAIWPNKFHFLDLPLYCKYTISTLLFMMHMLILTTTFMKMIRYSGYNMIFTKMLGAIHIKNEFFTLHHPMQVPPYVHILAQCSKALEILFLIFLQVSVIHLQFTKHQHSLKVCSIKHTCVVHVYNMCTLSTCTYSRGCRILQ